MILRNLQHWWSILWLDKAMAKLMWLVLVRYEANLMQVLHLWYVGLGNLQGFLPRDSTASWFQQDQLLLFKCMLKDQQAQLQGLIA